MIDGIDFTNSNESIDKMKMFFIWEYSVTDKIIIKQPTIQDIIDYEGGEDSFIFLVHILTGNTTFFRVSLWEKGIDWNDITDWEMFVSFVKGLTKEQTGIFLKNLDFSKMNLYPIEDNISNEEQNASEDNTEDTVKNNEEKNKHQRFILYDSENDIEFNELTYLRVRNYFRYMFNIFPKVEVVIKISK